MGQFLIVSKADKLNEYYKISKEYGVAFEVNDFFDGELLADEEKLHNVIAQYKAKGLPKGSTLHGAFFDVIVFSQDKEIRKISEFRMKQSMEIARELEVKGVVFHTNFYPVLEGTVYNRNVIEKTVAYLEVLLKHYPEIEIYLENMFDADPEILLQISKRLQKYANYGVCLDYAHARLSGTKTRVWVESLAPYVKHLHINDNDLKRDLHLPLGEGSIDWMEFAGFYSTYFQDCSVLLETTEPESQLASIHYLEVILEKVAMQGRNGGVVLEKEKSMDAEDLLEKIFFYMNELSDTKGFSTTILLLTDLGRVLVNSERASFWYWDTAKKQYWTLAALDSDRIIVPEGSGIVGATIQGEETILINDPYSDARFNPEIDKATGYVTKSILCMPVTDSKGEVIGAYQAINKLGGGGFTRQDMKRLALAAVYCGKTLESHLLYHRAQVDQLTGLKNRRGFYEYYTDYIVPKLKGCPVVAIMCDIDHFKKVNDTYGHNAGDAVLVHIAEILKEGVGSIGEVIRWGGEEFIIVLADKTQESGMKFAEHLRKKVEESACIFESQSIKVTMSFGVAIMNDGMNSDENIKNADMKLYEAKTTGRNKVVG